MSVRVYATAEEIARAREIGTARYAAAVRRGYRHRGPVSQGPEQHIVGVLAELLCARYFGLPFNPSIDEIDNVDLEWVEVRGRLIQPGRPLPDLAYSHEDKHRERPKVLARVDPSLQWIDIVGWMFGWELWQRVQAVGLAKNERSGCWFVPPPYHSVASLQDWVADAQSGKSALADPPADRRRGGLRGADPADAGS